jgi:thiamine-monophosphate kinase
MGLREEEIIEALKELFATSDPLVTVGIGDDAAVVKGFDNQVLTTDMAVEGVHFRTQWSSAFEIGRKVTAANLADIYAMGGTPHYLLLALSLTGKEDFSWVTDLAKGVKYEADLGGALLVGGDLARAEKITLSMSAIGQCSKPILRSGAQVGDGIYLSSLTGWSAAGLAMMSQNKSATTALQEKAIQEFKSPTLDYGYNSANAHSLTDVSDAVLIQGLQMANASGLCFAFDKDLIAKAPEFAELSSLADSLELDVWQLIFAGGEDHALLATGIDLPGINIGTVKTGLGIIGAEMKKAPDLWRHFQ